MDVGAILFLSGTAYGKISGRITGKYLVCPDAVGIRKYH